jgi:Purple acid Phosphatase, N-terminal domain
VLRRYPYLTDAIPGSVTVNWATSASGTGSVRYGPSGTSCSERVAAATSRAIWVGPTKEYQSRATLTGLTPGESYCYRPQRLDAQIAASSVDFALGAGGVAPSGPQADYGDLRSNSGGVLGPSYWTVAGSAIPVFPAVGNKGAFFPFVTNWAQPRAVATSNGTHVVETYCCLNGTRSQNLASTWYAFDYGRARF